MAIGRATLRCKILSLLCVTLIAFQTVWPSPMLGGPGQASEKASGYDGETIFRGLYFGQGPVAQKFPEIWKQERYLERKRLLTEKDEKQISEIQNKIVARLREEDKDFFDHFGKTLQSGDHVAIQKTLDETTNLMFAAVRKETGKDLTAPIVDVSSVYRYIQIWQWIYLYFYFYVYEFVFAFLYVGPIVAGSNEGVASMKGITRLQREEWIHLIATRLAAKG